MALDMSTMEALLRPLLDSGNQLEVHAYPRRHGGAGCTDHWFYVDVVCKHGQTKEDMSWFYALADTYGCSALVYVTDGSIGKRAGDLRVQFL